MRRWFGIVIVPISQRGVQRHGADRSFLGHAIRCGLRPLRSPQPVISRLVVAASEVVPHPAAASLCLLRSVLQASSQDRACGPAGGRPEPWRQTEPLRAV